MSDILKTGTKVSEIQESYDVISNDVFLYSFPTNQYDNINFVDRTASVSQIEEETKYGVLNSLGLKSMAYQDKYDYSRTNHVHDYSKIEITSYNSNGLNADMVMQEMDIISVLAQAKVDGFKININAQAAAKQKDPIIPIGELKFMCLPKLITIDEDSEAFDGWIYPDGRSIDKRNFPDAYDVFGDDYNREGDPQEKFRIPTLSDFIQLNPMEQKENVFERRNFQNGIQSHQHDLRLLMNGVLAQRTIQVGVGGSNNKEGGIHRGDPSSSIMPDKITEAVVKLSSENLYLEHEISKTTEDDEINETESTPEYMYIPVLMYIGKKVHNV